ncbi:MAG: riboflavin synthase [Planctomycetota bacterium]|nr:riboflavin synthase [Planctomycetota bacterium]
MFTGLVEGIAEVVSVTTTGDEMRLSVDLGGAAEGDAIGDSIALSGVCSTVTRAAGSVRDFVLSSETLRRTWLDRLEPGHFLNIEKSMRSGDLFGGHLVQGHVDAVAEVVVAIDPEQGGEMWVRLPGELLHYAVIKGSITLDGISLTIADLQDDRIMVAVIPHTAQVTTLGRQAVGAPLNVEVDILAKYVERMLEARFGDAT